MGVGRNLAYKKDEFFKVNGFIDHMKIRSGDDDLFVNQASKGSNTTCCYAADSFTYCAPKTKFFPCGVDKVERCLECHEQAMREYGGRIQIAKVKKQSTSEKSYEPVRFKLKC